jgi:hypothetical protein
VFFFSSVCVGIETISRSTAIAGVFRVAPTKGSKPDGERFAGYCKGKHARHLSSVDGGEHYKFSYSPASRLWIFLYFFREQGGQNPYQEQDNPDQYSRTIFD